MAIFVHAFMGVAAVILGFWLVASWRLQVDVKACSRKESNAYHTDTMANNYGSWHNYVP